jgi:hypothetical protein
MLDFMDGIVEAVEEFAAFVLVVLAKWVILLTAPVWILPYKLLRDRKGGKCENPDCNSCPFPPCEKGEAEND